MEEEMFWSDIFPTKFACPLRTWLEYLDFQSFREVFASTLRKAFSIFGRLVKMHFFVSMILTNYSHLLGEGRMSKILRLSPYFF